jgi:hypothetical protein
VSTLSPDREKQDNNVRAAQTFAVPSPTSSAPTPGGIDERSLRRSRPIALTAVLALLYIWIGVVGHGTDRSLPAAVTTWRSTATPVVAAADLLLGWFAIRGVLAES